MENHMVKEESIIEKGHVPLLGLFTRVYPATIVIWEVFNTFCRSIRLVVTRAFQKMIMVERIPNKYNSNQPQASINWLLNTAHLLNILDAPEEIGPSQVNKANTPYVYCSIFVEYLWANCDN